LKLEVEGTNDDVQEENGKRNLRRWKMERKKGLQVHSIAKGMSRKGSGG